jgi:hypothetical protein
VGPFSDSRVITAIAQNFVPVATNLYKIRARKDEAGDFFRAVQKKKDQYQGFWIVTPQGDVLAAHHEVRNEKNWTGEVLAAINEGLRRAGPLPLRQVEPRELLPLRGKGVQEDGSVSLALYVRSFEKGRPANHQGVFDTIELTAQEWKEFVPPEATPGASWEISQTVASKLSRGLSFYSDQSTMPRPNEVTQVELIAKVAEVRRGVAIFTLQGQIAAVHTHPFEKGKTNRSQAQFLGVATYDLDGRDMRYLLLYGTGTYRNFQPYDRDVTPLGFVAEWQRRGGP